MKNWFLFGLIVVLAACSAKEKSNNTTPNEHNRMFVEGRNIYTAAGEPVVLRGFNEMMVWSDNPSGSWVMEEMAKTGANAVRIVATNEYSANNLNSAIQNAIQNGMIPIPECHDATGEWDKLQDCVDYWLRPEINRVIQDHKKWILLNIANEVGDDSITGEQFAKGYKSAIDQIRKAGIRVPLIIDGPTWGRNYKILLDKWAELNEYDPEHAIIPSVHTYWVGPEGQRKDDYRYVIDKAVNDEIPVIFGEGPTPSGFDCTDSPYQWAMTQLEENNIGWLTWSWGLVTNGDCKNPPRYDVTTDGHYGNWKTEAGRQLAVDHPASVAHTSRRPCSIPNAGEDCVTNKQN